MALAMRASFSSERASFSASALIWLVEIADLRLELLDARMAVEQASSRLLGELGAQRHALLGEAADQLGIDDVGGSIGLAPAQHVADDAGAGLGVGLLAARGGDLGVDFAELLVAERRVVGADEQVGARAELLGLGLGVGDLAAQLCRSRRRATGRRRGSDPAAGSVPCADRRRRSHW